MMSVEENTDDFARVELIYIPCQEYGDGTECDES